jgi:hypothetical protein
MSKIAHTIFISILIVIVFVVTVLIVFKGISYYNTAMEERVYHPDHITLKPSGVLGHGMGIAGTLSMIIGMGSYMARKRYRFLSRLGLLKHWLEFHIFLCTLGPILVLFHTSYKFGGLVAISFWSMVAVFLSGIIGRFIYIQIPHSIEGRELSLNEVKGMKLDVAGIVKETYNLDEESFNILTDSIKSRVGLYIKNPVARFFHRRAEDRKTLASVKAVLRKNNLPRFEYHKIIDLVNNDIRLNRRIERLDTMHNLFKYWHVAHLPFALVMLIIMVIHVGVTILFGYRWIF